MDYTAACRGLTNADGQELNTAEVCVLDDAFRQRLQASASRMGLEALEVLLEEGVTALSVRCQGEQAVDQVAVLREGEDKAEILLVDDGISYEQISPYQLVEYRFESGSGEFMTCNIGEDTLEAYKGNKFGIWKSNMQSAFGGCAAAFLPELRRGYALCNVYDHMIFTSPAAEKADWETDHNGKTVSIPRPVAALRVWDSEKHDYREVDPRMPGAPDHMDIPAREAYWTTFLKELKDTLNPKYGEEFVEDCLHMDVDTVKAKYGF